jgi:phosphopantetheinyl transferase
MIFETVNTKGNAVILNFNYVTKIEEVTVGNPSGHPCCGKKGATLLKISVAHSAEWVMVACDHDGNDITEQFLKAYKEWGYQAK